MQTKYDLDSKTPADIMIIQCSIEAQQSKFFEFEMVVKINFYAKITPPTSPYLIFNTNSHSHFLSDSPNAITHQSFIIPARCASFSDVSVFSSVHFNRWHRNKLLKFTFIVMFLFDDFVTKNNS